jgi:hypothetical protein
MKHANPVPSGHDKVRIVVVLSSRDGFFALHVGLVVLGHDGARNCLTLSNPFGTHDNRGGRGSSCQGSALPRWDGIKLTLMKDHFNCIEEDFSKFASLLFERLHALKAALSEGIITQVMFPGLHNTEAATSEISEV